MLKIVARPATLFSIYGVAIIAALTSAPATQTRQTLEVSVTSLSFIANLGTAPPAQTVTIRNSGRGALKWSIETTVAWLRTSPTQGTNAGTVSVSVDTLAAGTYIASVIVSSNGGTATVRVNYQVNATPSEWIYCAAENGRCAFTGTKEVRYGANGVYSTGTYTDGADCNNTTFGDPITGVVKHCDARGSTSPPPPPSDPTYGPRASIVCPSDAVIVPVGNSIQAAISAAPSTATFCLKAGTHTITASIAPKSGNTFVGEYGAAVDGTGWTSSNVDDAAFRSINAGITGVTIRNLEIRNMPQGGVKSTDGNWTVEYCDIHHNTRTGVFLGADGVAQFNRLRNNAGNYEAFHGDRIRIESNEIAYSADSQLNKFVDADYAIFRGNWVHHNEATGAVWLDTECNYGVIENNVIEDNGWNGVQVETSGNVIIRNNTFRRNTTTAAFVSTSMDAQVYSNIFEDNTQAVGLFVECAVVGASPHADLTRTRVWNNRITVSISGSNRRAGALAANSGCADPTPYTSNTKDNQWSTNTYLVPDVTAGVFEWGLGQLKNWSQWQSLPQDAGSTLTQRQ